MKAWGADLDMPGKNMTSSVTQVEIQSKLNWNSCEFFFDYFEQRNRYKISE